MNDKSGHSGDRSNATKVSRRDFARSSVVAGAVAVTLSTPLRTNTVEAAGRSLEQGGGRFPDGWSPGTTIPAKYYLDEEIYLKDEAIIKDNLWLLADHESRIPDAGDYFVFAYGRGDSILVVRNNKGTVNAFHNVCRHRGSRLCRHDADSVPADPRLSVKQLGQEGSSPVFRCPYHAWTYDIDGSLIYAYGMQDDFDPAANGLRRCNIKTYEGHIFLHLGEGEAPDFEPTAQSIRRICRRHGTAQLKVAARRQYPVRGNWKLAVENFLECYHCGPAHRSLVTAHDWDYALSPAQRAEIEEELDTWVTGEARPGDGGGGMGGGSIADGLRNNVGVGRGFLNPGVQTGSLDGRRVAPLLPTFDKATHGFREAETGWSSAYWAAYDDHVAIARFTPRDVELTDCEILWLVHPDAQEGRDYDVEDLIALWHVTIQEDIWIVENNHAGVRSGAYGAGRYSIHETFSGGSPGGFVRWYMGVHRGDDPGPV